MVSYLYCLIAFLWTLFLCHDICAPLQAFALRSMVHRHVPLKPIRNLHFNPQLLEDLGQRRDVFGDPINLKHFETSPHLSRKMVNIPRQRARNVNFRNNGHRRSQKSATDYIAMEVLSPPRESNYGNKDKSNDDKNNAKSKYISIKAEENNRYREGKFHSESSDKTSSSSYATSQNNANFNRLTSNSNTAMHSPLDHYSIRITPPDGTSNLSKVHTKFSEPIVSNHASKFAPNSFNSLEQEIRKYNENVEKNSNFPPPSQKNSFSSIYGINPFKKERYGDSDRLDSFDSILANEYNGVKDIYSDNYMPSYKDHPDSKTIVIAPKKHNYIGIFDKNPHVSYFNRIPDKQYDRGQASDQQDYSYRATQTPTPIREDSKIKDDIVNAVESALQRMFAKISTLEPNKFNSDAHGSADISNEPPSQHKETKVEFPNTNTGDMEPTLHTSPLGQAMIDIRFPDSVINSKTINEDMKHRTDESIFHSEEFVKSNSHSQKNKKISPDPMSKIIQGDYTIGHYGGGDDDDDEPFSGKKFHTDKNSLVSSGRNYQAISDTDKHGVPTTESAHDLHQPYNPFMSVFSQRHIEGAEGGKDILRNEDNSFHDGDTFFEHGRPLIYDSHPNNIAQSREMLHSEQHSLHDEKRDERNNHRENLGPYQSSAFNQRNSNELIHKSGVFKNQRSASPIRNQVSKQKITDDDDDTDEECENEESDKHIKFTVPYPTTSDMSEEDDGSDNWNGRNSKYILDCDCRCDNGGAGKRHRIVGIDKGQAVKKHKMERYEYATVKKHKLEDSDNGGTTKRHKQGGDKRGATLKRHNKLGISFH